MKDLKKMLSLATLALFAMMLTSCKSVIGGKELSVVYVIFAVLSAIVWLWSVLCFLAVKKTGIVLSIISLVVLLLPFFIAPSPFFSLIIFGTGLITAIISGLLMLVSGQEIEEEEARKEAEAKAAKKAEEEKAKEAAKAKAKLEAEEKARKEAEEKAAAEAKAKAEQEAKQAAEAAEKAKKLSEKQAELSKLESDIASKTAEKNALGMDAAGIAAKAKLNAEIKTLQAQAEALKAEVEMLK